MEDFTTVGSLDNSKWSEANGKPVTTWEVKEISTDL